MTNYSDEYWMKLALEQANLAFAQNEVPVGAVAVCAEQGLVGSAYNQTQALRSPLAHAELLALDQAAKRLGQIRLTTVTLYVNLEPCPMCAGAILQARCQRLVFASRDVLMGAAGSVFNCINHPNSNHKMQIDESYFQQESTDLLRSFFKQKRRNPSVSRD